jgi:hypothetical protein
MLKFVSVTKENSSHFACRLNGCETWSLTLIEEHRLRMFEDRVLKRISVPKMDEIVGG